MTKDHVLHVLQAHAGTYVSGGALAEELQISRTAVWKAVEQLREEGYPIESVTRKGHRLLADHDVLSEESIRRYLTNQELKIQVYPTISSTNTLLKQKAMEDAPAGLALVAGEQTAGRGRLGRSFYSPSGSGLYLSLLLRPQMEAAEATRLTACAAVSAAEAIEELANVRPGIKWVNDLFVEGRKVCGILTEAGFDMESGRISYVIIGIGINIRPPQGDFPEEIREIAGSAFGDQVIPDLRNRLAAGILNRLMNYAENPAANEIYTKYKQRLLVLGKEIQIHSPGKEPVPGIAVDLEPDYALRVRLKDRTEQLLRSGEISIRMK